MLLAIEGASFSCYRKFHHTHIFHSNMAHLYYMQNINTTVDIAALQQGFNSFISDSKNKLQKLHGFIFKIHITN